MSAVRRWVGRPLWWVLGLGMVSLLMFVAEATTTRAFDQTFDHGFRATATVADDYTGGASVPLRYDSPLVGTTTAHAVLWDAFIPEPGERVRIDVDRSDPSRVVLAGDRYYSNAAPLWLLFMIVPLGVLVLRQVTVRRTRRLVASDGPSRPMLGIVCRHVWSTSPLLHLFPADATTGARPVCSIRLVSTRGLRRDEPAFPVEVKGHAGPFGRVVACVGDLTLWPRGRARRWAANVPLPAEVERPPRASVVDDQEVGQPAAGSRSLLLPLFGFAAAVGIGAITTAACLGRWSSDRELRRVGIEVMADVTKPRPTGGDTLDISYRLPGEELSHRGFVSPVRPYTWGPGSRYVAVVDPAHPWKPHPLTEPFDPVEPIVWGWVAAVVGGAWLVVAVRWRRASRRVAAAGPWVVNDMWRVPTTRRRAKGTGMISVALAHPESDHPTCVVDLHAASVPWWVFTFRPVQRVHVAGTPAPGEPLALHAGSTLILITTPPRLPPTPAPRRPDPEPDSAPEPDPEPERA